VGAYARSPAYSLQLGPARRRSIYSADRRGQTLRHDLPTSQPKWQYPAVSWEITKVSLSRDLWPWPRPWPWAHPGCGLFWRLSCASLVAIQLGPARTLGGQTHWLTRDKHATDTTYQPGSGQSDSTQLYAGKWVIPYTYATPAQPQEYVTCPLVESCLSRAAHEAATAAEMAASRKEEKCVDLLTSGPLHLWDLGCTQRIQPATSTSLISEGESHATLARLG